MAAESPASVSTVVAGTTARPARAILGAIAGLGAAQYVPSLVVLGQWSRLRYLPGVCRWQGPEHVPQVALTFDDGPDPEWTPRTLDTLDELGMKATFFVLGRRARRCPDLVEEISQRGHQLASHGDGHGRHLMHSPAWVRRDLESALDTLAELGHEPRWYRPAYGQVTGATLALARLMGLETVLWSAWGREWAASGPHDVADRITRRLQPGAIVLLHDSERFGPPGMVRNVLDALPLIGTEMRRRRLCAATMDQLVQRPTPAPSGPTRVVSDH